MYHSITFGNKNTWDNWHLIPTSRPVFKPPSVKKKTLDIQGGNGLIDLSESLTGYPLYNNREGSFEFIVVNDYWNWTEAYTTIMEYLHGQQLKAILEDDPDFCYEGRFSVNEWKSDKHHSLITVDYSVAPYKVALEQSVRSDISVTTETGDERFTQAFYGTAPVCPSFTVTTSNQNGIRLRLVNQALGINLVKEVSDGTDIVIPEFIFYGSACHLCFNTTASGTLSVTCEKRRL